MIAVLALAVLAAAPDAAAQARRAEEQAFAAVERKEWCPAMRLFLEADALAPSADFLMNASMAAEYGGDLAGALTLLERAQQRGGASAVEVARRARALEARIAREGNGRVCEQASAPAPAPAAPAPGASTPAPAPQPAPEAGPPLLPLAMLGGGLAATGLGVALTVTGALPWFDHAGAGDALRAAEEQRLDDKDELGALHARQDDARAAWEGWGRPLVIVGAALGALGVLAAAAGGAWFALEAE